MSVLTNNYIFLNI